eukprot:1212102-Prymnesium_polylepis.2
MLQKRRDIGGALAPSWEPPPRPVKYVEPLGSWMLHSPRRRLVHVLGLPSSEASAASGGPACCASVNVTKGCSNPTTRLAVRCASASSALDSARCDRACSSPCAVLAASSPPLLPSSRRSAPSSATPWLASCRSALASTTC